MHLVVNATSVVVFDFDGTLADSWHDIATALNRTLADAGLPVASPEQVRRWVGSGVKVLLERALQAKEADPGLLESLSERFAEHYRTCCLDETKLFAGMRACLDALCDMPLVVASNKPERFLEPLVDGLGLAGDFAMILGGDSLAARKPDPMVLQHVARRFSVAVESLWMVGDSDVDIETAKAAGARSVACTWGLRSRDELQAAGADHLVTHPSQIPGLIRRSL